MELSDLQAAHLAVTWGQVTPGEAQRCVCEGEHFPGLGH